MRREWYGSGTAEGEKGGRRPCDEEVGGLVNRPREGCGEGGGGGGGGCDGGRCGRGGGDRRRVGSENFCGSPCRAIVLYRGKSQKR